jgi:dTDP-glucose 4,6-dehydratase
MSTRKHLLITGGTGFIGCHVVEHVLRNTDWTVTILDRLSYAGHLRRLTAMNCWESERARVKFVYHDLRSDMIGHPVLKEISDPHPDYIWHLAAESHVGNSLVNPLIFAESNVIGTVNMLQAARIIQPEVFVQFSTDEVYGAVFGEELHREGEPHLPSNPYSASKAAAEDFAYSFYRTFRLPLVITNTMNVFAEKQDREKFVPLVMRSILKHEPVVLHCHKDDKGRVVEYSSRCWIHARNVAAALVWLMDGRWTAGGRYNIVGERHDVNEMADKINQSMNCRLPMRKNPVDFHSFNPGHDLHYGLDGYKMFEMGWRPPVDLDESLHRTVQWMLAHPEWLG